MVIIFITASDSLRGQSRCTSRDSPFTPCCHPEEDFASLVISGACVPSPVTYIMQDYCGVLTMTMTNTTADSKAVTLDTPTAIHLGQSMRQTFSLIFIA